MKVPELSRKEVIERARQAINEGEKWHSRLSIREIVFGANDGSVSTLALLAGVVGGALLRSQVIIAGLSGVIAGSISMAVGAYISSKSEIEHHRGTIAVEKREIEELPEVEKEELRQIYQKKANFTKAELDQIVSRLTEDKQVWLNVMMREELGLNENLFERPVKVALVMFAAFLFGGLVPLVPFFLTFVPEIGLISAAAVTYILLFAIGVWKSSFTAKHWLKSGSEMLAMGVLASVVPYVVGNILIVQLLSGIL
jgi:VIT1/CCC1 family predicted Fe2+/Mn2+ transporter